MVISNMSRLRVYVDQNSKELVSKYSAYLKDTDAAVFFIGENYDANQLKIELNHVVAKGDELYCVLFGDPKFDSGIKMQMGLATIINDSDDAPCELENLLSQNGKDKTKTGTYIAIIGVLILVIVAALLIPKFTNKQSEVSADNIKMDEIITKALIDAGADCIVIDGGISQEEMLTIEMLDLSNKGIDDITPLLYATNLKELDLSDNNISDITGLVALAKLEKIDLSNNPILNYAVLDYLPHLTDVRK